MKKSAILLIFIASMSVHGQVLDVETYQLANGLTVYLNEDKTVSNVYGAVWVNAGGKNDPADATGIAHYLEHMLFKGTTELGTMDYSREKPHLDSVKLFYDQLATATGKNERAALQMQINQQEIKASKYAVPNEFSQLLKSIGSTGLNASTNYDYTNYYNFFPSNQLYRWLDIYAHRFQNPVFRLFQSELEVVYEEKNRAGDDLRRRVSSRFNDYIYGDHPYSTQKVLGSVEHLKNPSLSKMYQFFSDYYVANNMALILSGNFDAEEAKPHIAQTFGKLRTGEVPESPTYPAHSFKGREGKKLRITPIKAGFMGYKLVPRTHPDRAALEIVGSMISNGNQTGFLDELSLNNEVLFAGAYQEFLKDDGSTVIFFVPKVFGKGLKKFEDDIRGAFERIARGEYSDEYLQSIKNSEYKSFTRSLEQLSSRGRQIGMSFILGISWEEMLAYRESILRVDRAELCRAARQYYGENYFVMQSRTGFPKKKKLKKPPYKAIAARTDSTSGYAKRFDSIAESTLQPQFIDFSKDVAIINDYIYCTKNPVNDVFTLNLRIAGGTNKNNLYPELAGALNATGTKKYSPSELRQQFAELGASYYFNTGYTSFEIMVNGLDEHLEATVALLKHMLQEFTPTQKTIDYLHSQRTGENKLNKNNPSTAGRMLYVYGLFGDRSYYKNRLPSRELKKMAPDMLEQVLEDLLSNGFSSVHYVGNGAPDRVGRLFTEDDLFQKNTSDNYTFMEADAVANTTIYLLHDKKSIQSYVYYIVNGEKMNCENYFRKEAFNDYYTNSLSGLLFQEVREFRSLAYATGGNYIDPTFEPEKRGRLVLFTGSQSDKTQDAVEVVLGLVNDMPRYESRVEGIRRGLILESSSSRPSFRYLSERIELYRKTGFTDDPNKEAFSQYKELTFNDIERFYQDNIKGKPVTVTIYGDVSKMDMAKLGKLGKVVELKMDDISTK
jgi:zinc protease